MNGKSGAASTGYHSSPLLSQKLFIADFGFGNGEVQPKKPIRTLYASKKALKGIHSAAKAGYSYSLSRQSMSLMTGSYNSSLYQHVRPFPAGIAILGRSLGATYKFNRHSLPIKVFSLN
ncbi:MAG: hypothetical protein ACLURY_00010 [Alistipes putredinis]